MCNLCKRTISAVSTISQQLRAIARHLEVRMVCSPLRTTARPSESGNRSPINYFFKGVNKPNGRSPFESGTNALDGWDGDCRGWWRLLQKRHCRCIFIAYMMR